MYDDGNFSNKTEDNFDENKKKWFEDNMLPILNKRGRWNLSIGK